MTFNILHFLMPLVIGLILIPLFRMVSEKTGTLNDIAQGDALKIHKKPTSLLGGPAIMLAILLTSLLFVKTEYFSRVVYADIALMIIFLLGFYDDFKWKHASNSKPLLKFALLIISVALVALSLTLGNIIFVVIPSLWISFVVSFIGVFIVINAVNYQDGMDGLAGGLVIISLVGFAILGSVTGNFLTLSLALIFLGAVIAFLAFNFPPAKIFMGDSGAYVLGVALSILAITLSKPYNIYSVVALIFIIGLPIFDGVFTNIRRLMSGKSIFVGDRSHFYDRLLQKGFSPRKTLAIAYTLQAVLVILGLIIYGLIP